MLIGRGHTRHQSGQTIVSPSLSHSRRPDSSDDDRGSDLQPRGRAAYQRVAVIAAASVVLLLLVYGLLLLLTPSSRSLSLPDAPGCTAGQQPHIQLQRLSVSELSQRPADSSSPTSSCPACPACPYCWLPSPCRHSNWVPVSSLPLRSAVRAEPDTFAALTVITAYDPLNLSLASPAPAVISSDSHLPVNAPAPGSAASEPSAENVRLWKAASHPIAWEDPIDSSPHWNQAAETALLTHLTALQHPPAVVADSSPCNGSVRLSLLNQWKSGTFGRWERLLDSFAVALHAGRMMVVLPRSWWDHGGAPDDYGDLGLLRHFAPFSACSQHPVITSTLAEEYLASELSQWFVPHPNVSLPQDELAGQWQTVLHSASREEIERMAAEDPRPLFFTANTVAEHVPQLLYSHSLRAQLFGARAADGQHEWLLTRTGRHPKAASWRDALWLNFLRSVLFLYLFQPSVQVQVLSNLISSHYETTTREQRRLWRVKQQRRWVQFQKQAGDDWLHDSAAYRRSSPISSRPPDSRAHVPLAALYVRRGDKWIEDWYYRDHGHYRNLSLFTLGLQRVERRERKDDTPDEVASPAQVQPIFRDVYVMTDDYRLLARCVSFSHGRYDADSGAGEGEEHHAVQTLSRRTVTFNPFLPDFRLVSPYSRVGFAWFIAEWWFVVRRADVVVTTLHSRVGSMMRLYVCASRQLKPDYVNCAQQVQRVDYVPKSSDELRDDRIITGWMPDPARTDIVYLEKRNSAISAASAAAAAAAAATAAEEQQ